ncbi:inositol-tetrakisphosphate 1-kinase 1-like [Coffea arabica]|uniref:inositol-1,3,4-trisphosphate 5/6-kinase n=1 Tax=Coffea arabica TaxID=13443 RepID=A0A6P6TW61_COFAR
MSLNHCEELPSPLEFSVIAKPLLADGIASSHRMSLVFNQQGLKQLEEKEEEEAPFVLQKFVNHGGVVFKVYVVGDYVQCVKRRSLPNILMDNDDDKPLGILEASHRNLLTYSQISNLTAAAASSSLSSKNNDEQQQEDVIKEEATAQMLPVSFLTRLAKALRNALGLHLFNFDVIKDSWFGNQYLVIDINYFSGYAKMPSYETVIDILVVTYSY